MDKKKKSPNKTKINVFLDVLLALIFIVEMEEHFTGLPTHELLGLVFGAAFVIHIILHWDWIVNITRTFFKTLLHESRFNYALNLALFIDLAVVTVTGIAISRTIGLSFNVDHAWETIHIIAAELSLVLVGLHVAMHWKWIATHVTKYLVPRVSFFKRQAPAQAEPVIVTREVQNGTA
ncbi:MAG: DUF4405 domain-containing protein [Anaerolineae bacterium]|nr:DUF4405 domain-containing protein [Anaerolineae bacterium]MCA9894556.1 DUF4405 domain-containing protein [Anaerolineae bacterium]MCB9461130.1 DUF4405 domain-containing protein [Anaerolineaceae bacterium]